MEGLLNSDAFAAASAVVRPASCWFAWARRMLLLLGSTLVLAGVIFFFAYNWSDIGKFAKFGLIESVIIACVVGACLCGRGRLSGKTLILSASVLVGVLLAVYGQIYQTGADAYELFFGWAALILGWVIVSQFAALWVVWLTLVNIGAWLYWEQVGDAQGIRYESLCLAAAALNAAALALREVGVRKGLQWLAGQWLRGVLIAAPLVTLSFPVFDLIFEFEGPEAMTVAASLGWLLAAAGGYACYRLALPDMIPLAVIVLNACILLLTLIAKLLFDDSGIKSSVVFLLFAIVILVIVSAAAFWLRRTAAAMAADKREAAR